MTMTKLSLLCAPLLLAGCAAQTASVAPVSQTPVAAAAAPARVTLDSPAPDPMRWTYASGEAAAASIQTWRALADYAIAAAAKTPKTSVLLGLPDAPGGIATTSCANKKPAVVFDVDETVILNRGYEYWLTMGNRHTSEDFDAWARDGARYAVPVPGAVTGIRRLREAGITVIYNTNRSSDTAEGTAKALEAAGVGGAVHGETLFLSGDDALGGNKDGRRKTISDRFCVVALAGDNLGDFAEVLNEKSLSPLARRALTARGNLAQLWGNGWFLIPNAAYGFWQKGNVGDVFPPEARWQPNSEGSQR